MQSYSWIQALVLRSNRFEVSRTRRHLAGEEVHDRPRSLNAWISVPDRRPQLPITPIPVLAAPAQDLSDTFKSPARLRVRCLKVCLLFGQMESSQQHPGNGICTVPVQYKPLQHTPAPQSVRRSNSRLSLSLVNLVNSAHLSLAAAHKPEAIDGSEMMRCDASCRAWNCRCGHASPLLAARQDR
jgi:hypothetical protein